MNNPVFVIAGRVRGQYYSTFVFQNNDEVQTFKATELVALKQRYGELSFETEALPGLKVGDQCLCHGEGEDVLTVEELRQLGPYRWSFGLSHGCWEDVAKCWKKVN